MNKITHIDYQTNIEMKISRYLCIHKLLSSIEDRGKNYERYSM